MFSPPFSTPDRYLQDLAARGFAVLDASAMQALSGTTEAGLAALLPDWDLLPPDEYLRDGGRYRQRRHASFIAQAGDVRDVPYRPHWQPVDYNALHGGMQRWFAPVAPATLAQPDWRALLRWLARVADIIHPAHVAGEPWYGEAHQFRIDTEGGIGRPTPEGAHRDGVDVVAVFLVARHAIKGGETRVFELDGPQGQRFTLEQPWSVLLMDDERVIHESTPIQPAEEGGHGHRDTLVVTLRAGGFLDPVA
ncbi:2OG-Fe dioxygenase family protein [Ottowia sp.]|uniref:2OG-Fe dioxygenase family protein n=1 Tax=Ottowia sp. TaxID=1898956 RepID=UPI002C2FCC90|nr:2OG-Fe dioxygenase family protein [Ottowia sp.]HOB65355.1 2OG-Fe dioxygenase family protein [Ottowia sp.]HPZ57854.1 2OG-Fe dioxygenase family protein [Ottowia sp.]HQD47810.1 2OG-Fe dioxygenase family protein [Ottowia sp.]